MYSNQKKGFSILDLLIKIIFAGIFIFILIWLFQKKIPKVNMEPFYGNVYRENIKYMQEAGESYFTDDKMPTEVGETVKITLDNMEKNNLILPFVDKDGKACDKNESYVSVTKLPNGQGYELRTYLVCSGESNYISKTLGCHTYCPTGNCNKSCTVSKVTEYQYKQPVEGTKTKYSCEKGYTLKGKYCYKSVLKDSKSAAYTATESKTYTKDAVMVTGDASLKKLDVVTGKKQLTTSTGKTQIATTISKQPLIPTTKKVTLQTIKTSNQETYSCQKTKKEQQCTTTYQKKEVACGAGSNNVTIINGVVSTTTSKCYESIPVQNCKDVDVVYNTTCTKTVYKYSCPSGTTESTRSGADLKCYQTTHICPSGTTDSTGSGANLQCYQTTYSCPSGTDIQEGSGSSLKCYRKTYSCPSGTDTKEGSGASLKCYQKTYSCPSGTDTKEGSGASLKCYKIVQGKVSYKCADSSYKLSGTTCTKTVSTTTTKYKCSGSYKLEGKKCNLYETKKVEAKATSKATTSYNYKWSKETYLDGWTRTGKTRTVKGEEICK